MRDGDLLRIGLPEAVSRVLAGLAGTDADAVLVGGCVRDLVHREQPKDWDVATSAPPEAVAAAFPGSTWQNPFGTVTVRGDPPVEVTTFRVEEGYRDRRRPDTVRWGTSLEEDLARRDFTINAMAWRPVDLAAGEGRLVDPHGGAADLERRLLRAVGDPGQRLAEDALRLVRAVRFAVRYDLALEPATEAAIRDHAPDAALLSGERVREELLRMLAFPTASKAFLLMEELGLLAVLLPELAALRGIPQAKRLPGDALDHSLRTVDALPAGDARLRLAGLLHDVGKASTLADGHFIGHELQGARLAEQALRRLRLPNADIGWIRRLVRHHMFNYTPDWTDAAVRRFVRRVGADLLADLFALRAADNAASGAEEPEAGGLEELRARVDRVLAGDPLDQRQLAVDGHDLVRALGVQPGPVVGRLLDRLLEAVLEDPSLNRRERLLELAADLLREPGSARGAGAHREA
ncbi:MAG TPA: CCA tRNA nucleotidyltransferase [candidate division Zixibacteria bacterium]|nr:CCA tRNA nucleotidyltransferase [candidate division Zixibacteria bacterium]